MRKAHSLLAALSFFAWLARSVEWLRGIRTVPVLEDSQKTLDRYPSLSVVVPARDEERTVEGGAGSLLRSDYPGDLEVIAVDDRSADRTGEVLEALRVRSPQRLRVLRVGELPEGWLGKNHALNVGAAEAGGEWLLFTDADVRFAPGCLREAVAHAVRERLDHLTLFPGVHARGALLRGFVAAFALIFTMTFKPWEAADPRTESYVGVGAFNLLRREVYEKIGGHGKIALRPDDDVKLAKLVKEGGFRQGAAFGTDLLSVEWHETVRGAVRGLGKSVFPGLDYSVGATAAAALALLLTNVLPFFGLVFGRGAARVFSGLNAALVFLLYRRQPRRPGTNGPLLNTALHPLSAGALVYATLRSAYVALSTGKLEWRGTEYPLEVLKKDGS